jgi:ABC-2 type transport system ATP-binding protein
MPPAVSVDLAIECVAVTKAYGDQLALDAVDLTVRPGSIHGLVGPNGAGKTTLLSILFGLVIPESGTVRLFGRSQVEVGAHWLDEVGGFVESPRFYPYLSGRRNLEVIAGLDGADARHKVVEVLDVVGLADVEHERTGTYSLGMRQRLGLAASLLREPQLLILDEPASGLDPTAARELALTMRQLASRGAAVVFSSHDMAQLEKACDTVTVLSRGRAVFSGDFSRLRELAPPAAWRLRTSDDSAALAVARGQPTLEITADGDGLIVRAGQAALDEYVVALGQVGVAIRMLVVTMTPLESLYFKLTGGTVA